MLHFVAIGVVARKEALTQSTEQVISMQYQRQNMDEQQLASLR